MRPLAGVSTTLEPWRLSTLRSAGIAPGAGSGIYNSGATATLQKQHCCEQLWGKLRRHHDLRRLQPEQRPHLQFQQHRRFEQHRPNARTPPEQRRTDTNPSSALGKQRRSWLDAGTSAGTGKSSHRKASRFPPIRRRGLRWAEPFRAFCFALPIKCPKRATASNP
jgi:hypothetical protein